MRKPSTTYRTLTAAALLFLVLPAAKQGCGPDVSLGGDGDGTSDCGGPSGLTCGNGEYCHYADESCGAADQPGVCTPLPDECNLIFSPVCGCDGVTYENDCAAASAGTSIAHVNACETNSGECGGPQNLACAEGEFCAFEDESCGAADDLGVCKPIPDGCYEIYAPVCGCDGMTYPNDCYANAAGVSIAHDGGCGSSGDDCGGFQGLTCEADEFCLYPGFSCGFADELGTCTAIPDGCTAEVDPVCGCDGVTYSNACVANAAGTSVAASGPCG